MHRLVNIYHFRQLKMIFPLNEENAAEVKSATSGRIILTRRNENPSRFAQKEMSSELATVVGLCVSLVGVALVFPIALLYNHVVIFTPLGEGK